MWNIKRFVLNFYPPNSYFRILILLLASKFSFSVHVSLFYVILYVMLKHEVDSKDWFSLHTTQFISISIFRKYQAIKDGHNGCHSKFWWKLWAFQTSQKQYAGSWTLCGLSGLQSWTMSWWVPLQVILCQINIFCHQLTQNMKDWFFFRFSKIYTNCSEIQNLQSLCFEFHNNWCKSSQNLTKSVVVLFWINWW